MADVDRTEVIAFDKAGKRVDPSDPAAHTGEATEYAADGSVIRRSYLVNPPVEGPAWDLTVGDGDDAEPVSTLEDLMVFLGGDRIGPDRMLTRVAHITSLPSWDNAPATLQRQVYAYLAE